LKSDDGTLDQPTGEMPVVSATDSRVTITGAEIAAEIAEDAPIIDPATLLPHWTDAPTGQVPIVVAREAAESDDPWAAIPAPAWREGEADWVAHEDQFDASILASDAKEEDARPWEFTLAEEEIAAEEILDEPPRPEPLRTQRTRHRIPANPLAGRAVRQGSQRSVSMATLTGILLAAVVFAVFIAGTLPVAVMVLLVLGLAAAEAYAGFRTVGAHPATILGIVAVLTLGVATYNKGATAIGAVSVLLLIFGFIWYLSAAKKIDVLDGLGATTLVICGVLTHNSVEATARHAADLGYRVFVVADACWAVALADGAGGFWPAEIVHRVALACLAGEYAVIVDAEMTLAAARLAKARRRTKEPSAGAGD